MKKFICVVLVCLLLCTLAGCMDDTEIRIASTEMLDALLAEDFEGSYAKIDQLCSMEEYSEVYGQFQAILSGVESYQLQMLQLNKKTTNGRTVTQAVYRIQSGAEPLLLSVATDSEISGLVSFYIGPDDETVVSYNGDLTNMRGASWLQWAVLMLAALEVAFAVWMFVDCCRHKMKRKVLWLLLILLGCLVVTCSISASSFRIRYNLGLILTHSALLKYTDGSVICRLQIPIGTIVYFAKRKKLLSPDPAPEELQTSVPEEIPET